MLYSQPTVQALRTAIPYIRAYHERIFVVKLGGRLCDPGPTLDHLTEQLALLHTVGIRLVVVHGGGDQVSALAQRLGMSPRLVAGRRVTDDATLELAKMVFAGTISTDLVAALRRHDVPALGLTGVDGQLLTVARRPPQTVTDPETGATETVDFGNVGDITGVRCDLLEHLLARRYVPVIGSLAADPTGQVFNVNADTVAAHIAIGLGAVKYFLLTGVDGVFRDLNAPDSLVSYLDLDELDELIRSGAVRGGMLPKLAAVKTALLGGVPRVHIVNGTVRDSILAEVFTNEGCGTLVVARRERNP